MERVRRYCVVLTVVLLPLLCSAQLDKIVIPAGTPEDQALQAISSEQDGQKKITMYEDFLNKFASNPAAVAYGNWQVSQYYQGAGDLQKAVSYGDKALAGAPHNLDIIVSQASLAQQMKDNAKLMEYASKGGQTYNSISKQPKPDGMSDQDFAKKVEEEKAAAKNSYEFLETSAFNAIADEKDAKARMSYIDHFTAAFPDSRFQEQVAQYAMYTLGPGQLNDPSRLVAFGEKTLATNPNSVPALLLLSNSYADESKPGAISKAILYSQKVIELSKANAPDADRSRKLSAGVAHSTMGYALMKQDKTAAAGQDDVAYATALYRLGYAYAKLNRVEEARNVLNEAVQIAGPVQQPSRDLLAKVNTARAKGK
ncbi:MAG: hypothetical protein DMG73_20820 [Acidobacteria bacterium]|nr:MAG: hypothetical protein DMG73_20820 [Acidobacteriota bacterium]